MLFFQFLVPSSFFFFFFTSFLFVLYTLGPCGAPMVTCGPSKQGKLSTHKSPAVCVPTFLGSPCMATAPTTSGSHHQPIQMSNTLFEVADCYVNPPCFSPARPLRTRTPGKMFLWFSISFIISSVLHPYSPSSQRLFINMLLMGSGGWSLWLEELRTWQPYQAVSYKVGTPPFPQVWAVTAMTPSHCAFVWPVLQLLCIPTPIEWEDPPSFTDHHNKQIDQKQNEFPPRWRPSNCQRWQFAWFWYRTKRFFMKHLRASCFHPPQPSLSTSGLRPPIFVTGKEKARN